jgi:hypothetical protein
LFLKSEYFTEGRCDAYCESGEYFAGGAQTNDERNALTVQPVIAVWKEVPEVEVKEKDPRREVCDEILEALQRLKVPYSQKSRSNSGYFLMCVILTDMVKAIRDGKPFILDEEKIV